MKTMKVIDFLYYYQVLWFKKRGKVLDPIARPAYALGICSLFWMMAIDGIIEYILFNSFNARIPKFVFVIVGIVIVYLLEYVYVKKKRYYLILEKDDPKFNVSDKSGMIISISFIIFSLFFLLGSAIIVHSIK
jgi:hypothetical protein